jgi:6-phosphogluconolactonase
METIDDIKPNITLVGSSEDLAAAALDVFVSQASKSIGSKGLFNVAISGGHTPERFFELLGMRENSRAVEWDKVQIFWVDERCVRPDAEGSNYGLAFHTFLEKVRIPGANVHRVIGESSDYAEAVRLYDETIRRVFNLGSGQLPAFDLIVLGMGVDGHIGSLMPNSYALFDTNDLVSAVYLLDNKYSRITLTHPVICAASHLVVLISGSDKAQTVREVMHGPYDEVKYPVHILWPILAKVSWIIDEDAGKYL